MQSALPESYRLEEIAAVPGSGAGPFVTGRVLAVDLDAGELDLDLAGQTRRARVATGCLVRPIETDRVLAFCADDEVFVLQVLERGGPNYATLALPGHGNLAIEGETVSLKARQRLALKADSVDLQARTLAFIADKTTWLSKALTGIVERWRISARSHEVSADTLTEKALTRIAVIDRLDSLRAESRSVKVAGIASETAQSKVIAVVDDLRMDGKRITMG